MQGKFAREAVERGDGPPDVAEALARKAFALGSADDIAVYVLRLGAAFLPKPPTTIAAAPAPLTEPPTPEASPPAPATPEPHPAQPSADPSVAAPDRTRVVCAAADAVAETARASRVSAGQHGRGDSAGADLGRACSGDGATRTAYGRRASQTAITLASAVAADSGGAAEAKQTPSWPLGPPELHMAGGDADATAGTGGCSPRAVRGWRLGRAARWGLVLAAAAAGVAVFAVGRRRR